MSARLSKGVKTHFVQELFMARPRNQELTDLHVLEETGANFRGRSIELRRKIKENPNHLLTLKGQQELEALLIDGEWHSEESIKTAQTSPVTGLRNRAALDSFLKRWRKHRSITHLEKGKVKPEGGVSLIHFDLGAFKFVNDKLGHAHGDVILNRTGRLLQAVSRAHGVPEKQVFHHGGDEFIIAVTGKESRERAESIAKTLIIIKNSMDSRPKPLDPKKAAIPQENTFKMGLATAKHEPNENLVELFKNSDNAAKIIGATTNHGYLHHEKLESLNKADKWFLDLVVQNVETRKEDEELPVKAKDRSALLKLLKKGELSLSRNNLREALKLIGREKRFGSILKKIPAAKGREIPDTRKHVKTKPK